MKKHALIVAPIGAHHLWRLSKNGRWTQVSDPKETQPAEAFIGILGTEACVWVAECSCKVYAKCPLAFALERACERWGSATAIRVKGCKG
jgi:hypothetical protein